MPLPNKSKTLPQAVILINEKRGDLWERMQTMFDESSRQRIAQSFNLHPTVLTSDDIEAGHPAIKEAQVVFGSWGFPRLSSEQIPLLPKLEIIFYAAGSIKGFGRPFLSAGISICSAKSANARVVADCCSSLIILSAKQFFSQSRFYCSPTVRPDLERAINKIPGLNRSKIGLIGCGAIARQVITLLERMRLDIHVMDPFLSPTEAAELGVTLSSLDEVFSSCDVISNHLPNLPELTGKIAADQFRSMKLNATLINTGRGAQVNETDLIEVFSTRSDLTAILDVTHPEPPGEGSALYSMPNVILTPHTAGCIGGELSFLLAEVIEASEQWLRGEKLSNLETLDKLDISA